MLRVGLTGGIACGKSHVLRRLAAGGLGTMDLDAVAHAVMAPGGTAYADVVGAFGRGVLGPDGAIDRLRLGAIVFADPEARARLDATVHPRVREEEARRAAAREREGCPVLVSDAALLVEAGAHLRFERLVVVHCPAAEQLRRLVARDGLSEAAGLARIDAQMPVDEKRRFAHVAIDTAGTLEETDARSDRLAAELLALARRREAPRRLDPARLLGALVHGRGPGPRGLDPSTLADDMLGAGGLELAALARRLVPAATGPWYRAAAAGEAAPWPEALGVVLAAWSLARGLDDLWLASAAASLARLTHGDDASVAGGCLAALVARDVAAGAPLESIGDRLAAREELARRWGGALPPSRVSAAARAAALHPGEPERARREAEAGGAEPACAGALVGLGGRAPASAAAASLLDLARRLAA